MSTKRVLGLIDGDGYTESFYLAGVPRLYPDLRGSYRPMTIAERVVYAKGVEQLRGMDLRKFVAGWLQKKLVSWDLKDAKDQAVPVTVGNLLRLKARLFDRLFGVVSTEEPGDDDPDRPQAARELDGDVQALLEAVQADRTVQEVREERDLKN